MSVETVLKTNGTTISSRRLPEGKFRVNASAWEDGKTILADEVLELRFRNGQVLVLRRPKLPDPKDMSKTMMELWGWEET